MLIYIPTIRTNRQTGAILVTALLLLVVMTIIAISATSTTVMEEKMASNVRQSRIAFQAAEVALRNGEALFVNGFGSGPTMLTESNLGSIFNGSSYPGLYSRLTNLNIDAEPVPFDIYDSSEWDATNSILGQQILTATPNPPPAPRFIIEFVGRTGKTSPEIPPPPSTRKYVFRITAIGFGQEQDAAGNYISRVLSSTYKTPL